MTEPAALITAAEVETPLGSGLEAVWGALVSGRTIIDALDDTAPSLEMGTCPQVDSALPPETRLERLACRVLARVLPSDFNPGADLLVLGTSLGGEDDRGRVNLSAWGRRVGEAAGGIEPFALLSTACSTGNDALLLGTSLVRSGAADRVVVIAADVATRAKWNGHRALGTLSSCGPRPFRKDRDGMVLSEGAAAVVLQSPARRPQRDMATLGHVLGGASMNVGGGLTGIAPDGATVAGVVRAALTDAGVTPEDISHVNAHATSTIANDLAEARGLSSVFSGAAQRPLVSATKANLGHALGATALIEAVLTLTALRHRYAPPLPLAAEMDELRLPVSAAGNTALRSGAGINLSLGFGGFHACTVFKSTGDL